MTCREFAKQIEGLALTELGSADAELLAHQSGCACCATLLQQRNGLAGAMQVLRNRTAAMEATPVVEQNVLRAFRQSAAAQTAPGLRALPGFRWSDLLGWRGYALAAAVVTICIGLGLWFAQRSQNNAQRPMAKIVQSDHPSTGQTGHDAQSPVRASASNENKSSAVADAAVSQRASLAQSEQAQGYTPLMLCDPISCSGDEEVVRMELPTTGTDGSASSQMADVIVGDDGLVRAIRIVQQQ